MTFEAGLSRGIGEEMIFLSCFYLLAVLLWHLRFTAEALL